MAICEITGKGKMYGHNVSFSQRHTRKVFKPNVSKRTLVINGQKIKCNVSYVALSPYNFQSFPFSGSGGNLPNFNTIFIKYDLISGALFSSPL